MLFFIYIGLIFLLAGVVQGLTGFGAGLVAIPLLCLVVDVKTAVPLVVLNYVIITVFLSFELRAYIDIKNTTSHHRLNTGHSAWDQAVGCLQPGYYQTFSWCYACSLLRVSNGYPSPVI